MQHFFNQTPIKFNSTELEQKFSSSLSTHYEASLNHNIHHFDSQEGRKEVEEKENFILMSFRDDENGGVCGVRKWEKSSYSFFTFFFRMIMKYVSSIMMPPYAEHFTSYMSHNMCLTLSWYIRIHTTSPMCRSTYQLTRAWTTCEEEIICSSRKKLFPFSKSYQIAIQ